MIISPPPSQKKQLNNNNKQTNKPTKQTMQGQDHSIVLILAPALIKSMKDQARGASLHNYISLSAAKTTSYPYSHTFAAKTLSSFSNLPKLLLPTLHHMPSSSSYSLHWRQKSFWISFLFLCISTQIFTFPSHICPRPCFEEFCTKGELEVLKRNSYASCLHVVRSA